MTKADIAAVLSDIAVLLELKGENPFKIRAYQAGARVIESLNEDELARRIEAGALEEVKGIGEALAKKITALHRTGRLEFYEELKASIPAGLVEMLRIPGVGPKKARALHDKLGLKTVAELARAGQEGKVAALEGFGEKSQEKILEGIRNREAYARRHLWIEAWEAAEPILQGLRQLPQAEHAEACGSLRRRMETVGDLDFLVATRQPQFVVDWFVARPEVKEVTARGDTKASVRLQSGLQADLRLVPPEQFVFTLHHLTGSKDHNVQMRQRALARGWSLGEWGLTPAKDRRGESEGETAKPEGKFHPASTQHSPLSPATPKSEAELFARLGLRFIPPELREGLGEIEAAEKDGLPRLVEEGDIRGVFHNHTTASDGHNTLEEMTAAAQALGFEYLGIADHSKASFQANGLDEKRLRAQVAAIRKLNQAKRFQTHVFTGAECDILPDGRLDFAGDLLAELDYVVVSVHSAFKQSREEMTRRIIRALEHPAATMLGHLTGRLLLEREGYEVDVEKVIDAAVANKVVIELNASPMRLDLDWRHWRKAAEKGLLCSINPDAHSTGQLAYYRLGVGAARKGWLSKETILNALPLAQVKRRLGLRKG